MIEINVWKKTTVIAEIYYYDLPLFRKLNGSYCCFEEAHRNGEIILHFIILTHDQLVIGKPTKKEPVSRQKIIAMIFTEKNLPSLEG